MILKHLLATIAAILITTVASDDFSSQATTNETEVEEYDRKLSEYIREVIENFRSQMPEGLPDIGIPPLDPLIIPDINENIDDNIVKKMELRMKHVNIIGISKFEIKSLKADLERGFTNFSIALPELTVDGYCYMDGKVFGVFPINGDGPIFLRVEKVSFDGNSDMNVTSSGGYTVYFNDLNLKLTFEHLNMRFDSLLGGQRWSQTLLKMLTRLGPKLFTQFHDTIMAEVNKALLKVINRELEKGTLKDLLGLISKD